MEELCFVTSVISAGQILQRMMIVMIQVYMFYIQHQWMITVS